jgi:cyclase
MPALVAIRYDRGLLVNLEEFGSGAEQMNRRTGLVRGLVAAGLGTFIAVAVGQAPPFATHTLTPNVSWVEGGGGNSTVIVGATGVIVVDAKVSNTAGEELLEQIRTITPKPVIAVILTHSDGDHINGLTAFPPGLRVIAHDNNKKEQKAEISAKAPGAPAPEQLPTEVVTKPEETLTIDGETLELYHWAPAHTGGDLVVYLPKEKIVATGDIVATNDPYPRIHSEKHGSAEGWIATAKGLVALDADTFIPGHGSIQTKAEIQTRLANAIARRDQVKAMVAQGKSLDEINAALGDTQKRNYKSWAQVCYEEMTKK